jgi:hypothetical protein
MSSATHTRATVPQVKPDGKIGRKLQVNDRSKYAPRKNTPKSQRSR